MEEVVVRWRDYFNWLADEGSSTMENTFFIDWLMEEVVDSSTLERLF